MLKNQRILGYSLIAPAMVVIGLFVFYPIFEAIRLSFYNRILTIPEFSFVGFETYEKLIANEIFRRAFRNTVIWVVGSTVLGMFFGGIIGIIIAQGENRITRFISLLVLIPFVMPDVVVAATWAWIYDTNIGILNSMLNQMGLIKENVDWLGSAKLALPAVIFVMAWRIAPLGALLVQSSYKGIPLEIFEAAEIDGANFFAQLKYIVLPLLKYAIIIGILLTMMWVMQNLAIVRLMTDGGPGRTTEILSTYVYKQNFQYFKESEASAASVIYFGFLIVISLSYLIIFRRVWVKET